MPNQDFEISVHDSVPRAEAKLVDGGLGDFNEAAAPLGNVRALACFARTAAGEVVGGAVGRSWGKCCELQQLWVAESARRKGIASALVRSLELHAKSRGCTLVYLETFSFQAPRFYQRLGYEIKFTIEGYPGGIAKHHLLRHL